MHSAVHADLILGQPEITADYAEGTQENVTMPDGSVLQLYKVDADYDPYDRVGALTYVQKMHGEGRVATGLLYVDPEAVESHDIMGTTSQPLNELAEDALCPGSEALSAINQGYR
jgi:2-oxoglutarate ferredoxin oxidoreductase subunit beta